jgi:hypothetical protein
VFVLYRGMRLDTGGVYFRVDIQPLPDNPGMSGVGVIAVPLSTKVGETHETLSKPSELAYRIVTLALATGSAR